MKKWESWEGKWSEKMKKVLCEKVKKVEWESGIIVDREKCESW